MEDYVVTMNTEWDAGSEKGWATQEPKMRARFDGVITKVLVKPGDIVKEGTPLCVVKKEVNLKTTKFPLQKMVRITRVPLEIFKNLDLTQAKDRYVVYDYIAKIRDEYLKNYSALRQNNADSQVVAYLENLNAGEPKEIFKDSDLNFPAIRDGGNIEDGNSQFVENMLSAFVPPLGLDAKTAKDFAGSATYKLGVERREISPQLRELLEIHGERLHGDKNYYLAKLETIPRKLYKEGKDVYTISSEKYDGATQKFLEIMKQYGAKADPQKGTEGKIQSLSAFKDAAVYANIYLNQDTPWTPEAFKELVDSGKITDPQNYFKWKNSKGEEGYWKLAPESAITIRPVDVPYYYENPTPILQSGKNDPNEDPNYQKDGSHFRMRVDYLLNFFKKHYDDGTMPKEYETLRPDDDIEDTPQGPPLPDATGCIFSGVSS